MNLPALRAGRFFENLAIYGKFFQIPEQFVANESAQKL